MTQIICFYSSIYIIFLGLLSSEQLSAQPTTFQDSITEVLNTQQKAWNEGHIDGFMDAYLRDDSISFTGSRGISYGWDTIYNNYLKGYPDRAAMGQLQFEILEVKALGNAHALVLGRFTLYRENDKPSGYFSLVWKRHQGQWRIIADHTSG